MNEKKNVLIYGIGSYKNGGVEAIINTTLKQIDKDSYNINVACYDYNYNKNYYKTDVNKYINHYKSDNDLTPSDIELLKELENKDYDYSNYQRIYQNDVLNEITSSDICLSAGGDNYCYGEKNWLYMIDQKIKDENKKLVLFGASLYEKLDDVDLINDMDLFDILLMRESISYNELKKYIDPKKLLLLPDPAFSLEKESVKLDKWYDNRKIIGINISPIVISNPDINDEKFKSIISLIDYILNKTNYSVLLFPHVVTEDCNDLDILENIYEIYKDNERVYLEKSKFNCAQNKYIISKCELTIVSRTHASIAAYSSLVPTLVIGYSVKSKGIAKDLFGSYENYVISYENLNEINIIEKFNWLNENKNIIKNRLSKVIPKFIDDSKHCFEKVVERLNENKEICDKNKCIGCGICYSSCPKNAIEMKKDKGGFYYPEINEEKCVHCNICVNNCPINISKNESNTFKKICYVAKNKDELVQKKSSSGGIFSILATKVLNDGGVVYGAYMDKFRVKHISITDTNDLEKIIGSKYTQSSLLEAITNIKEDVKNNKTILFSGTPCQVAAIKKLVKDYNNIIFVSVICHGVIGDSILDKYLKEEYDYKKIKSINYRTKDNGWSNSSIKICTSNQEEVHKFNDDTLMGLYLQNAILRESCYNCKFKCDSSYNFSDIILGDYWGVFNYHPQFFDDKGVSSVIVNTEKGKKFIEDSNFFEMAQYEMSNISNIYESNSAIYKSPKKNLVRYQLYDYMDNNSLNLIYQYNKNKKIVDDITKKVKNLDNILSEDEVNRINEELKLKDEQILSLNNDLSILNNEMNSIKNSRRYKIVNKIFDFAHKILRK